MSELLLDRDRREYFEREFAEITTEYGAFVLGNEVRMGGWDDRGYSTDKPEVGRHPADHENDIVRADPREHEADPSDSGIDDIGFDSN